MDSRLQSGCPSISGIFAVRSGPAESLSDGWCNSCRKICYALLNRVAQYRLSDLENYYIVRLFHGGDCSSGQDVLVLSLRWLPAGHRDDY